MGDISGEKIGEERDGEEERGTKRPSKEADQHARKNENSARWEIPRESEVQPE